MSKQLKSKGRTGQRMKGKGAMHGVRVLDLSDEKGFLCGKILAELGADVVKIEKLGGDQERSLGPFCQDVSHPERSLYWLAFNLGKRGITLNIETDDGQKLLSELVKLADIIVECFPPGYLDRLGIGFSTLTKINPGIIMVSVTPFGQTGPYAGYKAHDIVA